MSIEYTIDSSKRRVLVEAQGDGDFSQLIMSMKRVSVDPAFRPDYDVLADFRQLRYLPSLMDLGRLGGAFSGMRHAFTGRVAIVTASTAQLQLGRFAMRMAALIQFSLGVFGSREEARRWLVHGKENQEMTLKDDIRALLKGFRLAALATVAAGGAPKVRYVSVRLNDDWRFQFATPRGTDKVAHILGEPRVAMTIGGEGLGTTERWIQVTGTARLNTSAEEKKAFWHNGLNAYFSGVSDPEFALMDVVPDKIEYLEMGSLVVRVLNPANGEETVVAEE